MIRIYRRRVILRLAPFHSKVRQSPSGTQVIHSWTPLAFEKTSRCRSPLCIRQLAMLPRAWDNSPKGIQVLRPRSLRSALLNLVTLSSEGGLRIDEPSTLTKSRPVSFSTDSPSLGPLKKSVQPKHSLQPVSA